MNWLDKMNASLEYIEANLAGQINYELLAQKACCGVYQFQRIFSFVANVSLAEYIRRRRMTLAAFDLQNSQLKVIDIALNYGYESPEAFARAFQMTHGVTPTMARKAGNSLKAYPKISFQISIKGDVEMEYRIEQEQAFVVNGIAREFDMTHESCFKEIPEFWDELCESGEFNKMMQLAKAKCEPEKPAPIMACSYCPSNNSTKFEYMIGIANKSDNDILNNYSQMRVKAGTWAIFTSETCPIEKIADAVQKVNKRVYSEWLPTSKYEQDNYQQERYYTNEQGMYCEIWVMVKEITK